MNRRNFVKYIGALLPIPFFAHALRARDITGDMAGCAGKGPTGLTGPEFKVGDAVYLRYCESLGKFKIVGKRSESMFILNGIGFKCRQIRHSSELFYAYSIGDIVYIDNSYENRGPYTVIKIETREDVARRTNDSQAMEYDGLVWTAHHKTGKLCRLGPSDWELLREVNRT